MAQSTGIVGDTVVSAGITLDNEIAIVTVGIDVMVVVDGERVLLENHLTVFSCLRKTLSTKEILRCVLRVLTDDIAAVARRKAVLGIVLVFCQMIDAIGLRCVHPKLLGIEW